MKIKNLKASIFLFFAIIFSLSAQQTMFSKTLNYDKTIYANSIVPTFENGYILAGVVDSNGLLIKLDSVGNTIWSKALSPPNDASNLKLNSIISTNDSSYVIVGESIDESYEGDAHCIKINSVGEIIWHNKFNTTALNTNGKHTSANFIQQTSDLGFIIIGDIWDLSGEYFMMVVKLDSEGNIDWCEELGTGSPFWGSNIKEIPGVGYVLISYTKEGDFSCTMLAKLNTMGDIIWSKKYELPSPVYTYHGNQSDILVNDTCYVGIVEGRLTTIDLNGNILCCKRYGPSPGSLPSISIEAIIKNKDEKYILSTNSSILLMTDLNGNVEWTNNLLTMPIIDIESTFDKGAVAIGNGYNIGIIKMDSLGNGSDCFEKLSCTMYDDNLETSSFTISKRSGGTEKRISTTCSPIDIQSATGCIEPIVGIRTTQKDFNINIYPNPTKGNIQIDYNLNTYYDGIIEIYKISGEQILFKKLEMNENKTTINCDYLPSGIYFYRLIFDNEVVKSDKLIFLE